MFTKNWYKVIGSTFSLSPINVINLSGATITTSTSYISNALSPTSNSNDYFRPSVYALRKSLSDYGGVIIGTGTAPASLDDYCLSGDLITAYNYSVSVEKNIADDGCTIKATYTITNTGDEIITIGEIGLMVCPGYASQQSRDKVLLERTVLESPITIPAGGVGQVTYTITFNYPTD